MNKYIKGIVKNIIYSNDANGYTVGLIKIMETNIELNDLKTIHFVGFFHDLKEEQKYQLIGELVCHPKYGNQFNTLEYEMIFPTQKEELITFLSSQLFPIGEKTAIKIYNQLGNNLIDIIINNPNVLNEVKGISGKRKERIYQTLREYQSSNEIIIAMSAMGFSMKESLQIYNKYRCSSMEMINHNIYELIEVFDFNFKEIDRIALNNNIEFNDERRVLSLIIYIMKMTCFSQGSTYLYLSEIFDIFQKSINSFTVDELEYYLIKLNKKGKIIIKGDKYYLFDYYQSEEYIASVLSRINNSGIKKNKIEKYLKQEENNKGIVYDETQKEAITKAINNNFLIITGGPGTGKTTIISSIVNILKKCNSATDVEIALLAPTGRASKKMSESLLLGASTIHRFLKWDKESNVFGVNEQNVSDAKYIIVDEASMIDNSLMASLLKGLRDDIKLILVGDYYQLPSVREGQVLKDLIDCECFDVVKLNAIYRQNENSYIVTLANEIKNKELSTNFDRKKSDYNFISCPTSQVNSLIQEILEKYLSKEHLKEEIQVIAPMYKGESGIDNLNKLLQGKFNPGDINKKEIQVGDITYRVGDKILQLVNDPNNNVFNGEIGYILDISIPSQKHQKEEIRVNYDGNVVSYPKQKFIEITHAYAISVHKSQGNEYDTVVVPIIPSYKRMMYNKLIYTAITRCKKHLILLGDKETFIYSVMNDYQDLRKTSLKELITNNYK